MLKSEIFEINGHSLIRHWAEQDGKRFYIEQLKTGITYDEAVDGMPCKFSYKETDQEIVVEEEAQPVENPLHSPDCCNAPM